VSIDIIVEANESLFKEILLYKIRQLLVIPSYSALLGRCFKLWHQSCFVKLKFVSHFKSEIKIPKFFEMTAGFCSGSCLT